MGRLALLVLLLVGTLAAEAVAEEPVTFGDANLKAAVEAKLGKTDPTPTDMLGLTSLSATGQGIVSLTGLEYATNLVYLDIPRNAISDISPLAGLINLEKLYLDDNHQISDISALSGLTALVELELDYNQISDLSPLSALMTLEYLILSANQISDISPLSSLSNLETLHLAFNQISDISPLAGLTALQILHLHYNQISSISALSDLTNLSNLNLAYNQISDISPLADLTNLVWIHLVNNQVSEITALSGLADLGILYLDDNQINNISPLAGLTNMDVLHLKGNPLNWEACSVYIPQIRTNNPSIDIRYDLCVEEPVYFADAQLKLVVEQTLGVLNPTPSDMLRLTTDLGDDNHNIASLVGIEYATNLREVNFPHNLITDLSPLSGLTNLRELNLHNNQISNISPISGLTNLQRLDLEINQISDISLISGMTKLIYLYLYGNQIRDISSLAPLMNLINFELRNNPLNREAYCIYLPQIHDNNPHHGEFNFYPNSNPPGSVSASDGINLDRVRITWDALCPGPWKTAVFNYTVYRSNALAGEKTAISGSLTGIQFDDTTADPGVHYFYWVKSDNTTEFSNPDEGWRSAPPQRTLATSSTAGGSVSTPGEGAFQYDHGSVVAVVATAESNYHFVNWTGTAVTAGKVADASSANTTATMDADYTLQANFAIDQHSLTVTSDGNGSATGSGTYDWGSTVPVVATPNANHHFLNWTKTGSVTIADPGSASTTVTINGDGTVTAHFAIDQRTLTTSSTAGGTVSTPGIGSFQYDHGTTADVLATPQANHHFVNWTGTAVDAGKVTDTFSASTTVTADADYGLQANFAIEKRTLTTSATSGGTVSTPGVGSYPYTHGTAVPVLATPMANYHFVNWTGTAVAAGKVQDPTVPGTTVMMDADYTLQANFAIDQRTLVVSRTTGGAVTSPGEGSFEYNHGEWVTLQAKADPLFEFVGWHGGISADANPYFFTMDAGYAVKAHFESVLDVLYVDDNAPGDPGPGDPNVSSPDENGTPEHPFDSIQEAIEVAKNGAKIVVGSGTYLETIDLLGKAIEINGLNADDPNIVALPVISGQGKDTVVRCTQHEDPNCILAGLVITGGRGRLAGGILCVGSSPTVLNCLIVGNRATEPDGGGGVYCQDSNAVFLNCTISGNYGGAKGAGLWFKGSLAVVTDSIAWDNDPVEVLAQGPIQPVIAYTDVAGGWTGLSNMNADPLFALPGYWANSVDLTKAVAASDPTAVWVQGDYHLMSKAGRWDPVAKAWVKDLVTSPCIDAGDPVLPVQAEPVPNGNRINVGAYGGTSQASLSPAK